MKGLVTQMTSKMRKPYKHYAVFINDFRSDTDDGDSEYYDCDFFEILAKDEEEMMTIIDVMIDHGILIDDEYEIGESVDIFDINNFDTNLN